MAMSDIHVLTIDQVSEGQDLPELSVDVTATTVVLGAMASRDWRPMHHDKDFAVERNGLKNIFINTPKQRRLVRALHHRLDGAEGPSRAHHLSDESFRVPRGHHGAQRAGEAGDHR